MPHLRSDHAPHRGPRRRPGAGERPGAPRRRTRHAARRGRVRPVATTTRTPAGSTSTSCSRVFGSTRADLAGSRTRSPPPFAISPRAMPTYITLKEVKKRWGHGQEDIFPVAQFEKLWVDMTALPEVRMHASSSFRACAASNSKIRPNSTAGCATARPRTWKASANGREASATAKRGEDPECPDAQAGVPVVLGSDQATAAPRPDRTFPFSDHPHRRVGTPLEDAFREQPLPPSSSTDVRYRVCRALTAHYPLRCDGYGVQDTPAGAPVGAPIRTAGDASF